MSHDSWLIYLQRESDLLIRVSYHTQTAFEKHERAPERLPWNRNVLPLYQKIVTSLAPTQMPKQKLKTEFSMFISQNIGSSSVSF